MVVVTHRLNVRLIFNETLGLALIGKVLAR